MVERTIQRSLQKRLADEKIIILLGARQVGKTTLIHELLAKKERTLFISGEDPDTEGLFKNAGAESLKKTLGGYQYLVIDEAQKIENIGNKLKLITDQIKTLKVVVTGSSAFELANKVNEPLTGSKWEFMLYPFSFQELATYSSPIIEKRMLANRLLYGCYPEIVLSEGNEKEILKSLTDSFLYKDILHWEGIQKPAKLITLLQALAFQVGSMVSYNELAKKVGVDRKTIEKYIDLLEKVFVIFKVSSFSRNLRNELSQKTKIYFYDNGIRNALIAAFQPIENRLDIGALWENYMIAERKKYLNNHNIWCNTYYWRTTAQQEIDWIEEIDGMLHTYEIKWNPNAKAKQSLTFTKAYTQNTFTVIHRENYSDYLVL